MEKGIIYLIQPCELIGTSVFKIGYSGKTNLERCHKGYKKGSRYLCINECINPTILENKIKKEFNNKFKLIVGREYFEGDEENIKLLFRKLVEEHEKEYPIVKQEIEDVNNKILNKQEIKVKKTNNKIKINLKCSYCDNIYKSNSARILHYRKNHNELYEKDKLEQNNTKEYKCINCNKLFSSRQAKHYHIKKCTSKKLDEISELKNVVLDLKETIKLLKLTEQMNNLLKSNNSNILNI